MNGIDPQIATIAAGLYTLLVVICGIGIGVTWCNIRDRHLRETVHRLKNFPSHLDFREIHRRPNSNVIQPPRAAFLK